MPAYMTAGLTELEKQQGRTATKFNVKLLRCTAISDNEGEEIWETIGGLSLSVLKIVYSVGEEPGYCQLRVIMDQTCPVQDLLKWEQGPGNLLRYGVRVVVSETDPSDQSEIVHFVGNLWGKQVAADGTILITAKDDRVLLAAIPLRGAWVYDAYTETHRFCPTYTPLFNPGGERPGGLGNMSVAVEEGYENEVAGVFSQLASRALAPNSNPNADPPVSKRWTLKALIQYLRYYLTYGSSDAGHQYQTMDPQKTAWPGSQLRWMDNNERMEADLLEFDLSGLTVLQALVGALALTGDFGLTMRYCKQPVEGQPSWDEQYFNEIMFVPLDPENIPLDAQETLSMYQGKDIAKGDISSICNFGGMQSMDGVATSTVVEAGAKMVETRMEYNPSVTTNNLLAPLETATEETAWWNIIAAAGAGTAARLAAIEQARTRYPHVFCAYRLIKDSTEGDAATLTTLLASTDVTEVLQYLFRQIAGDQLTKLDGEIQEVTYPIRVEVYTAADGWRDVTPFAGVEVDDITGAVFLTGLTDDRAQDKLWGLLYEGGTLYQAPAKPVRRKLRINAAFPGETRLRAEASVAEGLDPFQLASQADISLAWRNQDGSNRRALTKYVLSPNGYAHESRAGSYPYGATGPLTDTPRDDSFKVLQHAYRQQRAVGRIFNDLQVPCIGFRPDLAGRMIRQIMRKNMSDTGPYCYMIRQAVMLAEFDALTQETTLTFSAVPIEWVSANG